MNDYKISSVGIAFIKNEEGCRLKSYQDSVGVWTIGYGHTGSDVKPNQFITAAKAEELLRDDLVKCESSIQNRVKAHLTSNQVDALCSFIFNVGVGGFESSTLLRIINKDPNNEAITGQFARWNKGTANKKKVVLSVLTARRKRESELYFK
ncbi:glycoside hydrolase family protein [Spirosoma sp. HMF4905]|uniref:Lysozyme n=1 Tax=Spirosoma arboris TaxID=2682092 RepID=A0A7K1SLB8_9BACT|nr:lysozyme [Spirosoma arboris]MVM34366.1 glycoside hydrolase family protein [Spirosoma arboris]